MRGDYLLERLLRQGAEIFTRDLLKLPLPLLRPSYEESWACTTAIDGSVPSTTDSLPPPPRPRPRHLLCITVSALTNTSLLLLWGSTTTTSPCGGHSSHPFLARVAALSTHVRDGTRRSETMALTKINYRRCAALGLAILLLIVTLKTLIPSPSASRPAPLSSSQDATLDEEIATAEANSGVVTTGLTFSPGANKQQQKPLRPAASEALNPNNPIRQRLTYAFPYDPFGKFPNYIWQTYKVTPASGSFKEEFRALEASWTEMHPGFVHEVIDDEVAVHMLRHFFSGFPDVLEAYSALPLVVLKADFFRYLILLARGGIYTDIDTQVMKSAIDWVPEEVPRSSYGMVIGIEADPDRADWADWYSRRIQFCQWTIQAKPGHPVLLEIVAKITEETLRRKQAGTLLHPDVKGVVEFTGPALWTDIIMDFFNDARYFDMSTSQGNITWRDFTGITTAKKVGDVIVLPITCFSPGIKTMGAGEDDDPMAFVKHYFEGKSVLFAARVRMLMYHRYLEARERATHWGERGKLELAMRCQAGVVRKPLWISVKRAASFVEWLYMGMGMCISARRWWRAVEHARVLFASTRKSRIRISLHLIRALPRLRVYMRLLLVRPLGAVIVLCSLSEAMAVDIHYGSEDGGYLQGHGCIGLLLL